MSMAASNASPVVDRAIRAARLEDGGAVRSAEAPGEWSLTIDSARRRTWKIEASLAALKRPLRVCSVRADGGKLAGWKFDERRRLLRTTWSGRRGTLVARGCG